MRIILDESSCMIIEYSMLLGAQYEEYLYRVQKVWVMMGCDNDGGGATVQVMVKKVFLPYTVWT